MRIAIRGFVHHGKLVFEDFVADSSEQNLEDLLPALAEKHANAMAAHELHMIEIEFLDEPDVNARFFRLGTDPSGMVNPLRLELRKGDN